MCCQHHESVWEEKRGEGGREGGRERGRGHVITVQQLSCGGGS